MRIAIVVALVLASLSGGAQQATPVSLTYPEKPGAGRGRHVVFLAGDEEYRSEEALPMLAKILSQRHGFKTSVLFSVDEDGTINPKNTSSLSDPAILDSADAIVMLLRFRNWPDETMARFERRLQAGTPIIALRTSTHAFNGLPKGSRWETWNYNNAGGFGKRVLGETWLTHWGRHKVEATRGAIEDAQRKHPVLRDVADLFGETDVYEAYPPADATILVRGVVLKTLTPDGEPADYSKRRATDKQEQGVNDPPMPVVWTRTTPQRQRQDQPHPDVDDGFGDGSGERGLAAADRQRRVLGSRDGRAGKGRRPLRRRIPAVLLRLRRVPQGAARHRLRNRQEGAWRAAAAAGEDRALMARSAARPAADAVKFFRTPADLRRWFEKNHATVEELWVGFLKKDTGRPSITWPESVDEALCVGWIDGIRKRIDEESYKIRFTPRRPGSIWSAVNIRRVAELKKEGRMRPGGWRRSRRNARTGPAPTLTSSDPASFPSLTQARSPPMRARPGSLRRSPRRIASW